MTRLQEALRFNGPWRLGPFGSVALVSSSAVVFIGTHPMGESVPLIVAEHCTGYVVWIVQCSATISETLSPMGKACYIDLGKCYLLIKLFLFQLVQSCVLAIKMDR